MSRNGQRREFPVNVYGTSKTPVVADGVSIKSYTSLVEEPPTCWERLCGMLCCRRASDNEQRLYLARPLRVGAGGTDSKPRYYDSIEKSTHTTNGGTGTISSKKSAGSKGSERSTASKSRQIQPDITTVHRQNNEQGKQLF